MVSAFRMREAIAARTASATQATTITTATKPSTTPNHVGNPGRIRTTKCAGMSLLSHFLSLRTYDGPEKTGPTGTFLVAGMLAGVWDLADGFFQAIVQALAVADGQFIGAVVGSENQHIARGIQNRGAHFAVFQVLLDLPAHFRRNLLIEIFRDVFPNAFALQIHWNSLPKKLFRAGTLPFRYGTSIFCNIMRARCSLTFTAATVIPSAAAVSSWFIPCKSRNTNTSR